jgi:H+/gluconate symporter-like permease
MIVLHTAIAIAAVVLLIIVLHVDPVISLVVGSIYLGLAGGLGAGKTLDTLVSGFGDIMAEVGLLIGFGVLIGSLLFSMDALQRLVAVLLRVFGAKRLPYVLSAALATIFPSIYVDVQLVLAAPLARSAAPRLGRNGLAMMGGSLTAGILVGYVFVVPGLGTVSIAGLLHVSLGTMLVYGLIIGPITAVLTTFLFGRLLKLGFWDPEKDEQVSDALREEEALAEQLVPAGSSASTAESSGSSSAALPREGVARASGGGLATDLGTTSDGTQGHRLPSLQLSLLPVLVPLVLIAFGAIANSAGLSSPVIAFLGNPVFALFVGLVAAYLLARRTLSRAPQLPVA